MVLEGPNSITNDLINYLLFFHTSKVLIILSGNLNWEKLKELLSKVLNEIGIRLD